MTNRWRSACGVVLVAGLAGATGCAKSQARSTTAGPPLQVPAGPPHVLVLAEEPLPSASALDEPAPLAPVSPAPQPPPQPPRVRVEPRPAPVAEPAEPKPSEPRTFGLPGDAGRERAILDRMAAASRALARVDRARLRTAEQSEFDQARRFIQQAEQAMKERNLVFAATLADKAASLAADLADR